MPIELKEYVGAVFSTVSAPISKIDNLKENSYTQTYVDENSLMVDIESLHSVITRNDTYYTPQCIKDSIPYWTAPYERPVIMHHNEKDGSIIGRVKGANFIETSKRSNTPALELIVNVGDEAGKQGVKNGTLATTSIGAIAHDIQCSICKQNLVEEGLCEHEKGETYDGKRCYWIINKIEPKEVSYVVVPSDPYAHNTRVYNAVKKKNNEVKESMNNIFEELMQTHGIEDVAESAKVENTTEGIQTDEEVKAKAKVADASKTPESTPEDSSKPSTEEDTKPEEKPSEEEQAEQTPEEPKKEEPKAEEPETKEDHKGAEGASKDDPKGPEEPKEEDEKVKVLEATIVELEKKVAELEAANAKLTNSVADEKKLKESAETQLLEFRKAKKVELVESVNSLREKLSLPKENVETLMESTEESLQSTIKNLKEFTLIQKQTVAGLSVLESPIAVSESKDNTVKQKKVNNSVKESSEKGNMDFEKEFTSAFSSIFDLL